MLTREIMTAHPISVTPETPAEDCARLMEEHNIGCVPVVSGDRVVGIVTDKDVLRAFAHARGGHEPGSSLVVDLRQPARDLLAASLVLHEQDAPVLSLATEPLPGEPAAPSGDRALRLIVRVGTINPGPIVASLRAAGLECEEPRPNALPGALPETRGAPVDPPARRSVA